MDEAALTEAVDRTAVDLTVKAVPIAAVVDFTVAGAIPAARVLLACRQPHHGTGIADRIEVSVD